jgi:predicted O-methyltransferase YrrM
VLVRLRRFVRSRWHWAVGLAGLAGLPFAAWVAFTGTRAGLVGLLLLQAVALIALALVGSRALTIYRAVGRLERRVDTMIAALQRRQEGLTEEDERVLTAVATENDKVRRAVTELQSRMDAGFKNALGEESALHNLYRIVDVDREMPAPIGFAASPRTLLRLVDISLSLPPDKLIVECGSGASTVWLAHACRRAGSGRVVALEHDERYAQATREAIARSGLAAWAEVRSAPLKPVVVGDETFMWYSPSIWSDLEQAHLLFVDGPPGRVGPRSRYPAFPLLAASLAHGAIVALDDTQRPDEQAIGKSWLREGALGAQLIDQGFVGRTWLFGVVRTPAEPPGPQTLQAPASSPDLQH